MPLRVRRRKISSWKSGMWRLARPASHRPRRFGLRRPLSENRFVPQPLGIHMRHTKTLFACSLFAVSACTPFILAPGAAQVRVTNVPADVAGCSAVGNIRVPADSAGVIDISHAVGQLRNQAIGLGGNVAFVTEGSPGF